MRDYWIKLSEDYNILLYALTNDVTHLCWQQWLVCKSPEVIYYLNPSKILFLSEQTSVLSALPFSVDIGYSQVETLESIWFSTSNFFNLHADTHINMCVSDTYLSAPRVLFSFYLLGLLIQCFLVFSIDRAASIAASVAGEGGKKRGITVWPEWSDADINAEKWVSIPLKYAILPGFHNRHFLILILNILAAAIIHRFSTLHLAVFSPKGFLGSESPRRRSVFQVVFSFVVLMLVIQISTVQLIIY